jgi:hypothetical protein
MLPAACAGRAVFHAASYSGIEEAYGKRESSAAQGSPDDSWDAETDNLRHFSSGFRFCHQENANQSNGHKEYAHEEQIGSGLEQASTTWF